MADYFQYGDKEIYYLKSRDLRLAEVIDKLGIVKRKVIPDLFTALVYSIVGQQISTKAHKTIWQKLLNHFGTITPRSLVSMPPDTLQSFGISFRKADYIQSAVRKILSGEFNIDKLRDMSDEEACRYLSSLDGVGIWTAQMLLLHSLQRPDILSFSDAGVQRGLRMLYHHREITTELFEKYRRRYSPYGSTASLYLWAISSGAVASMKDYAPKKKQKTSILIRKHQYER